MLSTIMSHRFIDFMAFKGDIPQRNNGSLISMEKGKSIPFSLNNLQERGKFFVDPNEDIYEGQVIGENSRSNDLVVNITKTKKLTNMRSSGADDKVKIATLKQGGGKRKMKYTNKGVSFQRTRLIKKAIVTLDSRFH